MKVINEAYIDPNIDYLKIAVYIGDKIYYSYLNEEISIEIDE